MNLKSELIRERKKKKSDAHASYIYFTLWFQSDHKCCGQIQNTKKKSNRKLIKVAVHRSKRNYFESSLCFFEAGSLALFFILASRRSLFTPFDLLGSAISPI